MRFRQTVPGLYSRMVARKKDAAERERLRDEAEKQREATANAHETKDHPNSGPSVGRRPKRVIQSTIDDPSMDNVEDDASEGGSEADLGPLRSLEQIETVEGSADAGQYAS